MYVIDDLTHRTLDLFLFDTLQIISLLKFPTHVFVHLNKLQKVAVPAQEKHYQQRVKASRRGILSKSL